MRKISKNNEKELSWCVVFCFAGTWKVEFVEDEAAAKARLAELDADGDDSPEVYICQAKYTNTPEG